MNNTELTIADIAIRTDSDGRYYLNDLHKAAGGNPNNQPAFFMRRVETYTLIAEIANSADSQNYEPTVSRSGRTGGTYVCKEMVYAYAMWISPDFHLKVIRAYDTLQTQGIAVADHAADDLLANPLAYFERVLGQAKQLQAERDRAVQKLNVYKKSKSALPH